MKTPISAARNARHIVSACCCALIAGISSCSQNGAGSANIAPALAASSSAPEANAPLVSRVLVIKGLKKDRALLVRGSEIVRGLPLAAENAVPALYGEYVFGLDALAIGESNPLYEASVSYLLFRVWYTATPLTLGEDWNREALKGFPAGVSVSRRELQEAKREVWLFDGPAFRLFLETPLGFEKSSAFLRVFSERFSYYARYAASTMDFSFPAQVDL